MNSLPTVSLIICTYNREELLVQTLKCALQQNYKQLEIVVVDQTRPHTSETDRFLDSIRSKINYVFLETPSLTKARNTGIHNSSGEIIIFIDDDVVLDDQFVANHVSAHNRFDVVQGRIIEAEMTPASRPHWLNRWIKYSGSNDCITEGPINVVTGCNFSFKRKVIDEVGYFDEFFSKLALREDSDFGYRCYKAGVSMGFSPQACLRHLRSSSGGVDTGINNMYFSETYYCNDMYFARKHFSRLACMIYEYRLRRRGCREVRKIINRALKNT